MMIYSQKWVQEWYNCMSVSENLGATAVTLIAPADISLTCILYSNLWNLTSILRNHLHNFLIFQTTLVSYKNILKLDVVQKDHVLRYYVHENKQNPSRLYGMCIGCSSTKIQWVKMIYKEALSWLKNPLLKGEVERYFINL